MPTECIRPTSVTTRTPRALPWAVAWAVAVLTATPAARADEPQPTPLEAAWQRVERVEDLLEDDEAAAGEVAGALEQLVAGTEEATAWVPDDAPREVGRSLERLHGEVIDLLLEGLLEADRDGAGRNRRASLNEAAATLLGRTPRFVRAERDRARLSRRIVRALQRLQRNRPEAEVAVYEGAFVALARLGSPRGLAWLIDEQIHTRKQPEEVARLGAALRGLRQATAMTGRQRFGLFEQLRRHYMAVESLARTSSADVNSQAAARFWGQIQADAIGLAQWAARYPTNEEGEALASMAELVDWFRDHDDVQRAPWSMK